MHECQEIWSANINQKEDRFLIYERDLLISIIDDANNTDLMRHHFTITED